MKNKFKNALNGVKAEEQLKMDTYAYLQNKVYANKRRTGFRKLAAAFAFAAVIFLAGLFSFNLYFTERAYIDIDVNPSIELKINRFNRVIAVRAYNSEGESVVGAADVVHKTYNEALDALTGKMAEMGYIKDTSLLTATVQMADGEDEGEMLDALEGYLKLLLQEKGISVERDVFAVDYDTKLHSHEQNLSPAKYLAILELQSYDPAITFDSCRDESIGEIKQQTHEHMGTGYQEEKGHGNTENHESASENSGASGSNHTSSSHENAVSTHENAGSSHKGSDNGNAYKEPEGEHKKGHGNGKH